MLNKKLINKLNYYGSIKEPYLFIISFDQLEDDFILLKDLNSEIKFEINKTKGVCSNNGIPICKQIINFNEYKKSFDLIQEEIRSGNSYLLNLTFKTKINIDLNLDEIYDVAKSRFKIKYKNKFVCFSPERFVEMRDDKIYTFPMKGTIDALLENAEKKLINNEKEIAEHTMTVDLLRNDLSIISKSVRVDKLRYVEKIQAGNKELLHVSSQISGELDVQWKSNIGNIFNNLLPAGSISGAPKKSTINILNSIENYKRGFYTGIVSDSNVRMEYEELIDKIYIPS
jgi:para-aminobenzoate synthetase component 1